MAPPRSSPAWRPRRPSSPGSAGCICGDRHIEERRIELAAFQPLLVPANGTQCPCSRRSTPTSTAGVCRSQQQCFGHPEYIIGLLQIHLIELSISRRVHRVGPVRGRTGSGIFGHRPTRFPAGPAQVFVRVPRRDVQIVRLAKQLGQVDLHPRHQCWDRRRSRVSCAGGKMIAFSDTRDCRPDSLCGNLSGCSQDRLPGDPRRTTPNKQKSMHSCSSCSDCSQSPDTSGVRASVGSTGCGAEPARGAMPRRAAGGQTP